MNATLLRSLLVLTVVLVLVFVSAARYGRNRSRGSLVQLVGSAFLVIVALVHIFEAQGVFPQMGWGRPDSAGHYIDLGSAAFGLVLVPVGFILGRIEKAKLGSAGGVQHEHPTDSPRRD